MYLGDVSDKLKQFLVIWLVLLALPVLFTIAANFLPFWLSGFALSNVHGQAILYSFHKAALWLIPTSFLVVLYLVAETQNRMRA